MEKKSPAAKIARNERMNARRAILEELFNDFYDDRRNIYQMNFFRGIFFGFGSVLGGTVVVALVVWILSFFVQLPFIGPSVENAKDQIQSSQSR